MPPHSTPVQLVADKIHALAKTDLLFSVVGLILHIVAIVILVLVLENNDVKFGSRLALITFWIWITLTIIFRLSMAYHTYRLVKSVGKLNPVPDEVFERFEPWFRLTFVWIFIGIPAASLTPLCWTLSVYFKASPLRKELKHVVINTGNLDGYTNTIIRQL